jgi:hypothetical protein
VTMFTGTTAVYAASEGTRCAGPRGQLARRAGGIEFENRELPWISHGDFRSGAGRTRLCPGAEVWRRRHDFHDDRAEANTGWLKSRVTLDEKGFIKTGPDLMQDDLRAAEWPLTCDVKRCSRRRSHEMHRPCLYCRDTERRDGTNPSLSHELSVLPTGGDCDQS